MHRLANSLVALSGSLILGFIAIFQEWIRSLIWKPSLKISIREGRQDCHKTFWTNGTTVYYFNFWIENEGSPTARNIEIHANRLRYESLNKTWEIVPAFPPMNLKWAHTGKDSCLLLLKGAGKQCNLGHITDPSKRIAENEENPSLKLQSDQTSFFFDLIVSPNHRGHIVGPGLYRLDITMVAENHKPVSKTVELRITGKWSDIEDEMFKHGVGVHIL